MLSWHYTHQGMALTGSGEQALLAQPMTAFFASRQCPGAAIRAAMDWALQQAKARQVVISGFHSPLEQSVLTVLLQGRMAVVSTVAAAKRLTLEDASLRNAQVAQLATSIVVASASPGGSLADLLAQWRREERQITTLSDG